MEVTSSDKLFSHPFSLICGGISSSGKTSFCKSFIENIKSLVNPLPKHIIFSYAEPQAIYKDISNCSSLPIKFVHGITKEVEDSDDVLIIIDDQQSDGMDLRHLQETFLRKSHHQKKSVFVICQNLYPKGKFSKDIRVNTHYFVIMKSISLSSQVRYLGYQLFPEYPRFLVDSYKKATERPYSYLLIILKPDCDDRLRVQSGILPGEEHFIFLPK